MWLRQVVDVEGFDARWTDDGGRKVTGVVVLVGDGEPAIHGMVVIDGGAA